MSATLHAQIRRYGRGWMIATEPTQALPGAGDELDARRAELHPPAVRLLDRSRVGAADGRADVLPDRAGRRRLPGAEPRPDVVRGRETEAGRPGGIGHNPRGRVARPATVDC